jgi:hypothetical protein
MHGVQGELFPFVSAETVRALARQIIANMNFLEPETGKEHLLRMIGELHIVLNVQEVERTRQLTGVERSHRTAVMERLDAVRTTRLYDFGPQRWQSRRRRTEYKAIAPAISPSCVT